MAKNTTQTKNVGSKEHAAFWEEWSTFSESFVAKHKRQPKVFGPDVAAAIDVANEGDGQTEEEWCEMFERMEQGAEPKKPVTAAEILAAATAVASDYPAVTNARNLASIAAKDAGFVAFMHDMGTVNLKKRRGIMDAFIQLDRVYGGKITELFPRPGFKAPAGSNAMTDIYEVAGKNAKGEPTVEDVSMYDAFADSLPEGVAILADIENLALDPNDAKVFAKHKGLTSVERDSLVRTYTTRLSDNRKLCKDGVKVAFALEDLKTFPKLRGGAVMGLNDKGEEVYSNIGVSEPFYIQDNSTPTAWMLAGHSKTMTPNSFIGIKWDKVKEAGGDWTALLKVMKRSKKTGSTPTATHFAVHSLDHVETGLASLWGYIEANMKLNSEGRALLDARFNKDEKFRATMFEFKDWLVGYLAEPARQKLFTRDQAAENAKNRTIAEAMEKGEVKAS